MTPNPYSFYEWKEPNFRAVNKFYKRQKHKGSASGEERVFVISKQQAVDESEIVAAVRLVPAESYYWLRSLYVDQSLRGKGLGSQLLSHINQQINMDIHCFPYTHLEGFYQSSGYEMTSVSSAPQALQQLYERYNRKGDSILFMSRPADKI